jgi:plastocyanin
MRRLIVPLVVFLTSVAAALSVTTPALEAGAGGGGHGGCLPRQASAREVPIQNFCFNPTVLYVDTGDTVEWRQLDSAPHNVTLLGGEIVGGNGQLVPGDTVTRAFDTPGVYAYYCSIHPSMLGVVVAGDPATAASTAGQPLTVAAQAEPAPTGDAPPPMKGSGPEGGVRWAEALVGVGLSVGLLAGVVKVGGGRIFRRAS